MYCPYTNSSPPRCFTNEINNISENIREAIREALKRPKKEYCISLFNNIDIACDFCVKVTSESESMGYIVVQLEFYMCSYGCKKFFLTITIPKNLIET